MVAEYRPPARAQRRSRTTYRYNPDTDALRASIHGLWQKERLLGAYAPVEEVCLDLEVLDSDALRALRARIRARLDARVADVSPETVLV